MKTITWQLDLLNSACVSAELVLSMGLKKNKQERDRQEGVIQGIKLSISLLENYENS